MSRAERVLATVSVTYVQFALTIVVGFWLTPFLLRHLGKADFGLWSAALPIVVYVALVDFGVITILQRNLASAVGRVGGDFRACDELPQLIGKTLRLVLWQCPILAVAAVVAWLATPSSWADMKMPLAVLLASLVVSFPLRIGHAILMGLQDLAFVAKVGLAMWILGTCLTIGLAIAGWGLLSLAASWGITQLTTQIVYIVRVRLRFGELFSSNLPALSSRDAFDLLRSGFWVLLAQVATTLSSGSDMLIIAAVLTPLAVVPYALTGKPIAIVINIPVLVAAAAVPALSEMRQGSSRSHLGDVCTALNQVILLISCFLACVVVVVNRAFVGWWVGDDNFAGNTVVILLALGMVLSSLSRSALWVVFAFGYERRMSVTTVLTGILTFGSTILLVRWVGIAGAPLSAIIGISATSLPPNLLTIARETQTSVSRLLWSLFPVSWRAVLLLGGAAVMSRHVPQTFVGLAGASTVAACVYTAVMFPLVLREPLGRYVRPRLENVRARLLRKT